MKTLLLLATLFSMYVRGDVKEELRQIPAEHLQDVTYLFDVLFLQQDGAYTLFGDKPISSAAGFIIPQWESTLTGYPGKLAKSWATWQKYQHMFPIKNYLIVCEKLPSQKSGSVAICIYVINKKKLLEIVNHYSMLFETILKEKIIPETLLKNIETGKKSILSSIHHNEILLGILLGYGEHNATAYAKSKLLRKPPFFNLKDSALVSSDEYYPMMQIHPIQFKADLQHPETKLLQKKNNALRRKVTQIYSQGDLLEITLSQLCL